MVSLSIGIGGSAVVDEIVAALIGESDLVSGDMTVAVDSVDDKFVGPIEI